MYSVCVCVHGLAFTEKVTQIMPDIGEDKLCWAHGSRFPQTNCTDRSWNQPLVCDAFA